MALILARIITHSDNVIDGQGMNDPRDWLRYCFRLSTLHVLIM